MARKLVTKEKIGSEGQRRQVVIPSELTPAQAKQIRHGIKQIKDGRFKLWRDVKDELGR
jgi:hypothetical protein